MKFLFDYFKTLSLRKGPIFTIVGLTIVGVALFIMGKAQSVTSDGVELLIVGLVVSGLNSKTIDKIRGKKNTPSTDDSNPPS